MVTITTPLVWAELEKNFLEILDAKSPEKIPLEEVRTVLADKKIKITEDFEVGNLINGLLSRGQIKVSFTGMDKVYIQRA